ncbi:MAG: LytTR family DNA-binding domain-containing protein [Clostridiales bacterium]|nr:LytTR family DNA-binding domain-containing protein [Clostridiales bacterium]
MVEIAVVEDNPQDAALLEEHLRRYQEATETPLSVTLFSDGAELLEPYTPRWDLILLDIQMAQMDGMETARRIRQQDEGVVLVFVTSMTRYAVEGYRVNALDYLLKPVTYPQLKLSMDRVMALLRRNESRSLLLPQEDQLVKVSVADILYAEVQDHELRVVTTTDCYRLRATLNDLERKLEGANFARCNRHYLVNLRNVTSVGRDSVKVGDYELPFSRPMRKPFLQAYAAYLGVEL